MLTYLNENKEWIFSGIGILAITAIWSLFKKIKKSNDSTYTFNQKSGKSSTNYQGHTIHINQKEKDSKEK
jgi:hypothetical protein